LRWVLSILIVGLMVSQTLSLDISLAPGLSLKNAFLYLTALVILLRIVISGNFRMELPGIHAAFGFLLLYATVSMLIALLAIKYPNYEAMEALISLKAGLYEHAIFFAVFFYGVQTVEDSISVTDVLLAGIGVANAVTVLDASGVLGLNIINVADPGTDVVDRVQGAFGEANQHAIICAMALPAMLFRTLQARGGARTVWAGCLAAGVAALFMTASRGAIVALILASIWGAYFFRRYVSAQVVMRGLGIVVVMLTLIIIVFSANYTDLMSERLFVQTFDGDIGAASSGRSWIWAQAISVMMESPWTFITGFGWNVYSSMSFAYAPHNTYLGFWFNLGLPGVVAFTAIFVIAIFTARSASNVSELRHRLYLSSFAIGLMAVAVSIFFVELHYPWAYVWMYMGLSMRLAVLMLRRAASRAAETEPVAVVRAVAPRMPLLQRNR
jgi:O-antigen ligase